LKTTLRKELAAATMIAILFGTAVPVKRTRDRFFHGTASLLGDRPVQSTGKSRTRN
jgi:hypothetical protein